MAFDVARLRAGDVKFRIDQFININIQSWAEEELLQRAQKLGWAKGLSENALSYMWIETQQIGNKIGVDLIWDYKGPNDEPISVFLENGTRAHEIVAKGKIMGGSDVLAWQGKDGKMVFRPKVKHPGTQGMFIIKRAMEEGFPRLKSRIKKEVEKKLEMEHIGRR